MGTSSSFGGPGGKTPLVPSWLEPTTRPENGQNDETMPGGDPPQGHIQVAGLPGHPNRFAATRSGLSRFARSGGSDRASLGRAVSRYVLISSGGPRLAARRMGSARKVGGRLLNFLSDVITRGAHDALRTFNLGALAGHPIEEIFAGLADCVCPDGGSIDEGIARDAFIETIANLAENGITDLDALTADQMQTVFELYATYAIENRLCNDVGSKVILLPRSTRAADRVQAQLRDFIRRGVADALTSARDALRTLTPENVLSLVNSVYERAFEVLLAFGQAEAEA